MTALSVIDVFMTHVRKTIVSDPIDPVQCTSHKVL
jgi:hypothetical protein